jgi:hypothetical protein
MWHRRRKQTRLATPRTGGERDQADEFRDAVAEEAGEFRELTQEVHDAITTLKQPHTPDQPAVRFGQPVHFPGPTTPPSEWHASPDGEAHVADFADVGLDIVTPILMALLNGWVEGGQRARKKFYADSLDTQRRIALELSRLPTVIDPAVSFAPGSYCFMMTSSDDKATVVPGGQRHEFRRRYQEFKRQHRAYLLAPLTASGWAGLIHNLPWVSFTPSQADQITAWIGKARERRPRGQPTVAVIIPSPASNPR